MPKVYRGMLNDGGRPKLGESGDLLGVRTPTDVLPGVRPDIIPDEDGNVHPMTGGMSVSPSVVKLPPHRIPKRLRLSGVPDARGSDKLPYMLHVWAMGEGEFVEGQLAPGLYLRLDPQDPQHGLIEPDRIMRLEEYRRFVANTQQTWTIEEVVK
jgi:hypothetical protein